MIEMKGQTAWEYLITYGWAIIVILIVLGVLGYYGKWDASKWKQGMPTCENMTKDYPISSCIDIVVPTCTMPDNITICRCDRGAYDKLVLSECEMVLDKK